MNDAIKRFHKALGNKLHLGHLYTDTLVEAVLEEAHCALWDLDARGTVVLDTPETVGVAVEIVTTQVIRRITLPHGSVPRIGELVCLDEGGDSAQVISVVWFLPPPGDPKEPLRATVVLG